MKENQNYSRSMVSNNISSCKVYEDAADLASTRMGETLQNTIYSEKFVAEFIQNIVKNKQTSNVEELSRKKADEVAEKERETSYNLFKNDLLEKFSSQDQELVRRTLMNSRLAFGLMKSDIIKTLLKKFDAYSKSIKN